MRKQVLKLLLYKQTTTQCTITDLQSYARTLALTTDVTVTNVTSTYNVDPATFADTVYAAYYIHNNYNYQLKLFVNLIKLTTNNQGLIVHAI